MDLVIGLLQSVLIARPRVRPILRWPTTSKKDRSQYATASGDRIYIANIADRSHLRQITTNRTIKQSYNYKRIWQCSWQQKYNNTGDSAMFDNCSQNRLDALISIISKNKMVIKCNSKMSRRYCADAFSDDIVVGKHTYNGHRLWGNMWADLGDYYMGYRVNKEN